MTLAVQCELSGSEMPGVSVHVVELKVPEEAGEALKVTVPEGFDFVPAALSSTCASQVEAWLRTTVLGEHVTGSVSRGSLTAARTVRIGARGVRRGSAVTRVDRVRARVGGRGVGDARGAVRAVRVGDDRCQRARRRAEGARGGWRGAEGDRPRGVSSFVPAALSSTCASQVEAWLRTTVLGEHVTVVSVARLLTVSTNPSGSVLAACGEARRNSR